MQIIVITSPQPVKNEALICNSLFSQGLELLHLRKPGEEAAVYEKFIGLVEPQYRKRIVIHDHYFLAEKYKLHGIHLRSGMDEEYIHYTRLGHISISCHSIGEINSLPFSPAYCFLSPIFDSISKKDYHSPFSEIPDLTGVPVPVIALGGITPEKVDICRRKKFAGIAALGYIWEEPEEALQRYLYLKTPFVMSIAGFDPSAGAGVMADLKTFETTGCYGLGISSALTFQNKDTYTGTHWIGVEEIIRQCDLQFRHHRPGFVKIGLIESFATLDILTDYLLKIDPEIKIIWDPVLKASAGTIFHQEGKNGDQDKLHRILERIYLITPNTDELKQLFGTVDKHHLQSISRQYHTNILWKGGHNEGASSDDYLITPENIRYFSVLRSKYDKHGTGCILSSAIVSALARGHDLAMACDKAQLYVASFINSNNSMLGYHTIGKIPGLQPPCPGGLNLQYITAPRQDMTMGEQAESVCRGGIRWIQLRMKDAADSEFLKEGRIVKEICRRYNALFIINDKVEIARQLEADGVHLGKEDMEPGKARMILGPGKIVGATCNTWEDILLRQAQGVDYIGLGPFTFTTTKEKLSPVLGLEGYGKLLARMKDSGINIPVFAIGGITEADIPLLMQTGIQGIALSGLIKNNPDMALQTQKIIELLNH